MKGLLKIIGLLLVIFGLFYSIMGGASLAGILL